MPAIEIDGLLAPIAPDNTCGADLRYTPTYDRIRELRREDDARIPQGVWQSDPKQADWNGVAGECLRALETQSKDLQIAAWLLEAWLHLRGFQGAADGFRLMHMLCKDFWDDLYPRVQDGDVDFRLAPVIWVNERLPAALRLIPLTAPESLDIASYNLADWEMANQAETQRKSERPAALTFAQFHQSAMLTPIGRLKSTHEQLSALLESCAALDQLLDERLGRDAPGLMPIRGMAESAIGVVAAAMRERGNSLPEQASQSAPMSVELSCLNDALTASPESIQSRSHAYRLLADAADFLSRTEPHSPTPYLIRRAIAWGSMSLEELLPELVRNQAELGEVFRLLNVRATEGAHK